MDYDKIVAKLKELEIDEEDFDYMSQEQTAKLVDACGPFVQVASKGGEGQGEEYWLIYHFTAHNVYIKVSGFYTSYDGVDWSYGGFSEVKPVEKTMTVYE